MSTMKKTLVLGASTNPSRYAYTAVHRLNNKGHEVVPLGIKEGEIDGIAIQQGHPDLAGIDTVTIYLSREKQVPYYDYILHLNPSRIIFNPGAENPELMQLAREKGIEVEAACTLVMLTTGTY